MTQGSSYRTILRSSLIVGGAQVITIAVGLVKMKAVALLLGPAGVGLAGLYMNLVQASATVAALGLGTVATRQIATAQVEGGEVAVGQIRRAVFWATLGLACLGAALFWLASGWIARSILADESQADDVAWLTLGVALTVAAGSQAALLVGLRRVGDLARINIGAAITGAVLGVLLLWLWGAQALIAMILAAPLASYLLGLVYVARLGPPVGPRVPLAEMAGQWRAMLVLGLPFMTTGVVSLLAHLAARALVQRELGLDALGYFQAAWTIGMTYLGFVLSAMATDYYPRLTAAIRDREQAARLVNEQTEVALLLCAPVLLAMLGLAPWVIRLLYSAEFEPAIAILRWQLLGDILKVMSWPLGFVFLATGAGKTFLVTDTLAMTVFLAGIYIGLPLIGVEATGVAFLALYAFHLPLVRWLGGRMIGFRWSRAVKLQAVLVIGAALLVDLASRWADVLGAAAGLILAGGMGMWALTRLSEKIGGGGRLGRVAELGKEVRKWVIGLK
ncbi:PST family polysaccharide transporter [Ancylobacter aquaticus]|uniref:PST family polysaccharide transporter n=1 Tax=Ancylobacter aquaticus TaxID=100 RepID=A0A4R1H9E1_ANCAQ|nr:O-antigen translocase [Ancylobacter aquaticus]TCK16745.1 PST family polysaccharide transporter [Ancylobacter aquaticus]